MTCIVAWLTEIKHETTKQDFRQALNLPVEEVVPCKRAAVVPAAPRAKKKAKKKEEEEEDDVIEEILRVEKLLNSRSAKDSTSNEIEYLVKWQGFTHEDNSWEPRGNLGSEAAGLIRELRKQLAARNDKVRCRCTTTPLPHHPRRV